MTEQDVVDFLQDELGLDMQGIDTRADLFDAELLDSFSIASVVAFLEEKGGVTFTQEAINLENLGSVERMVTFVNASGGGGA